MNVDLYADPGCPWAWAAYRWLDEVAPRRQLRVRLRPYSLTLRDGTDSLPAGLAEVRRASHRALRVCAAIQDEARRWDFFRAACEPAYAALRRGEPPVVDVAGAIEQAGVARSLIAAADDTAMDDDIRASMGALTEFLSGSGEPGSIPAIVLHASHQTFALRGPLLDPAPSGHAALELWDALELLARTTGFYEISRPRPTMHSTLRAVAAAAAGSGLLP